MRVRNEDLGHSVFIPRAHSDAAFAAAALVAIDREGSPLEIATSAYRDNNVFLGDEVFDVDLAFLIENLCATLVTVLLLDVTELFNDDLAQLDITGENLFQLSDANP